MRRALWLLLASCIDLGATRDRVCQVRGFCDGGDLPPPPDGYVRVTVEATDGATGEVEWLQTGQRCGTGATCDFPLGDGGYTLLARPGLRSGLRGWGGVCSGRAQRCDGVESATALATFAPANLAFVTQTRLSVAGIADAGGGPTGPELVDALCNQEARDAGLPGMYRAFMSSFAVGVLPSRSAAEVFGPVQGGWSRLDGKPIARSGADLLAGRVLHPVLLDPMGVALGSGAIVATGAAVDGGPVVPEGDCYGWTRAMGAYTASVATRAGLEWTRVDGGRSCTGGSLARFYCLGVDGDSVVFPEGATGRRVFVSQATLRADAGMKANADALCAAEATDAGLGGSWELGVMPLSISAPWVRPDGVPVVDGSGTLFGTLVAPIDANAWGDISPHSTVHSALPASAGSCSPQFGLLHDVEGWFNQGSTASCQSRPVYCVEQ